MLGNSGLGVGDVGLPDIGNLGLPNVGGVGIPECEASLPCVLRFHPLEPGPERQKCL